MTPGKLTTISHAWKTLTHRYDCHETISWVRTFLTLNWMKYCAAPKSSTPLPRTHPWLHVFIEVPLGDWRHCVGCSAPKLARKSSWRSPVLSPAMRTFAEFTVFDEATNPPPFDFYPPTANSAFVLQRSDSVQPDDSHWHTFGEAAEVAARHHLLSGRSLITPARLHVLHFCPFPSICEAMSESLPPFRENHESSYQSATLGSATRNAESALSPSGRGKTDSGRATGRLTVWCCMR